MAWMGAIRPADDGGSNGGEPPRNPLHLLWFDETAASGVDVELRVWPEMFHVWHACVGLFEEASAAIDEMTQFIWGKTDN